MKKIFKEGKQKKALLSTLALTFLLSSLNSIGQTVNCDYEITPERSSITKIEFQPGDTICLMAGSRGDLYLKNITGTAENPIVIINKGGQSIINSDLSYGLKFAESKYVVISGSGDQNIEYGIYIQQVTNGNGLDIGNLSSDFEVEHIEISNTKTSGIVAKTEPNCIYLADRDNFTMFNVKIHHNYIHNTGNEGMYIGSSFFLGQSVCDSIQFPHIIDGVEIYNNRVEYTGWDAIQVGSAINSCNVHDNFIYKDSQAEALYQMSGIMINTGSSCHVYNNQVIDGKGTGISMHSTGGQKIFNNLIVNAGRDYLFDDQTKQKFGIFCKYTYIQAPDSSFHFYNNTIINPKSDGIRFMNDHSEKNRFINNIIINPGAYDYYKNLGSSDYEADDAYIHNYLDKAVIFSINNIFERSAKTQFFADTLSYDYHLTTKSPAVNTGYDLSVKGIVFDIENNSRPFGNYFDIGAYELQLLTSIFSIEQPNQKLMLSPNPASDFLNLNFHLDKAQLLNIKIVSIDGKEFPVNSSVFFLNGVNNTRISISHLPNANYIVVLYNESIQLTQIFQKY